MNKDVDVRLCLGDCLEILPTIPFVDKLVIITDPPYPDNYQDEYGYFEGILEPLTLFNCRQLIFWTAKEDFPLSFSSVHIWDKLLGVMPYERIFDRNGGKYYKVYKKAAINSTYAAIRARDEFTEHPSQKPIQLMRVLIEEVSETNDYVLDPFMGSGTTGVAAVQLGRHFIGIEKRADYFAIARRRIEEAQLQMRLPI